MHPSAVFSSFRVTHAVGLLQGCIGHTQECSLGIAHWQDMSLETGHELKGSRAMNLKDLLCFNIDNVAKKKQKNFFEYFQIHFGTNSH